MIGGDIAMKMIGVIGAGTCNSETYELAGRVGAGIAEMGATLVCGGLGPPCGGHKPGTLWGKSGRLRGA